MILNWSIEYPYVEFIICNARQEWNIWCVTVLYVHVKLIGNYSFRVETHKILRHQHTRRTQACRQSHMQTHEVCKNDNIIIFRRETQKHFFIRAVAKHKKGRNSRNNFFKNIVMVRKKKLCYQLLQLCHWIMTSVILTRLLVIFLF